MRTRRTVEEYRRHLSEEWRIWKNIKEQVRAIGIFKINERHKAGESILTKSITLVGKEKLVKCLRSGTKNNLQENSFSRRASCRQQKILFWSNEKQREWS